MSGPILGVLIDPFSRVDAVHIAIAPITACETLKPGDHVGFVGSSGFVGKVHNPIGVIDPFLKGPVEEGESCWMFMYPNTITGLRHDWVHPAFPMMSLGSTDTDSSFDKGPAVVEESVLVGVFETESKLWLENFASKWGMNFSEMVDSAVSGKYVVAHGVDLHSKEELGEDHAFFWLHMANYTGQKFTKEQIDDFSWGCSC